MVDINSPVYKKVFFLVFIISLAVLTGFLAYYFYSQNAPQPKLSTQTSARETHISALPDQTTNSSLSQDAQTQKDQLQKYLTVKASLLGVNDNISLYFRDFNQNYIVEIDPTRSWIPASTIKAFVALEAFRQRRLKLINFDQKIIIKKENVVSTFTETYDAPTLIEGVRITIRELLNTMIEQSDNTAYNTLLDVLDRRNINATLRLYEITDTVVGEKLNLDDDQAQLEQQVRGRQINKTTARDLAKMFELLYEKKIPDADEILSIFKRQKLNEMIPALLPTNVVVAHKTGVWSPYYHDGGLVYKPSEPFVLSIYTNSNSSDVVAQLAKIAYFKNISNLTSYLENIQPSQLPSNKHHILKFLSQENQQSRVLGIHFKKKFVTLTAADLGITVDDLRIDKEDVKHIDGARIIPSNIFYGFKKLWEAIELSQARTNNQKVNTYLKFAANRVAEIKTIFKNQELKDLPYLFDEFNKDLKSAYDLIKSTDVPNVEILYVKQLNDFLFGILADNSKYIGDKKQSLLLDQLYNFYRSNKIEIANLVENTGIENPFQYEPVIGTIEQKDGNEYTILLKNGSTKKVLAFDNTSVRNFHQTAIGDSHLITLGARVAIVGEYADSNVIVPIFILQHIPANFPQELQGIVTEINLDKNSLKLQDEKGEIHFISIADNTLIKASDTEVSLDGIKTGSQVVVFGENTDTNSPAKAITIIIVSNASGLNEKIKKLN